MVNGGGEPSANFSLSMRQTSQRLKKVVSGPIHAGKWTEVTSGPR